MSATTEQWLLAAVALTAAAVSAVRMIAGQRKYVRLYGSARDWQFRSPFRRRVPGLPRDGLVTGDEEGAFAAIVHVLREDRRR